MGDMVAVVREGRRRVGRRVKAYMILRIIGGERRACQGIVYISSMETMVMMRFNGKCY